MADHVAYWTQLLSEGTAIAFGPTSEGWGLGLVEVASPAELASIEAADPVIRAEVGFQYQIVPMLRTVSRPRPS